MNYQYFSFALSSWRRPSDLSYLSYMSYMHHISYLSFVLHVSHVYFSFQLEKALAAYIDQGIDVSDFYEQPHPDDCIYQPEKPDPSCL